MKKAWSTFRTYAILTLCIGAILLAIALVVNETVYEYVPISSSSAAIVVGALASIGAAISGLSTFSIVRMEENRLRPKVVALLDFGSIPHLAIMRIENVGATAANDVQITYGDWRDSLNIIEDRITLPSRLGSIFPNEKRFVFALGATHAVFQALEHVPVRMTISYSDARGEKYKEEVEQNIGVSKFALASPTLQSRQYDEIKKISRALENTSRTLEKELRAIERVLASSPPQSKRYDEVRKMVFVLQDISKSLRRLASSGRSR